MIRRLLLILVVLAWCGPSLLLGQDRRQPEAKLRSVQADFTQEKHLRILGRPLVSKGRFIFQAPDSLRWEYLEPFRSVLLMHQGQVRKFIRSGGRMVEETGMDLSPMRIVMTKIGAWLDGRFTENDTFSVRRMEDGRIRLVPKDQGMRRIITAIELVPGERPGLLRSVTIFEGADDTTSLSFSQARLNRPVDPRLFVVP